MTAQFRTRDLRPLLVDMSVFATNIPTYAEGLAARADRTAMVLDLDAIEARDGPTDQVH